MAAAAAAPAPATLASFAPSNDYLDELHASRVYARMRRHCARASPTPSFVADWETLETCPDTISAESSTLFTSKSSAHSNNSTIRPAPSLLSYSRSSFSWSLTGGAASHAAVLRARRRGRAQQQLHSYHNAQYNGRDHYARPIYGPTGPPGSVLPFSAQRAPPQPPVRPAPTLTVPSHTSRANQQALLRACATNSLTAASALLAAGIDPNARDEPPSWWAGRGASALHVATMAGHADIVRLLIRHGARIDEPFRGWRRALHESSRRGDQRLTALLLELGATVDSRDDSGYTPLHVAAMNAHAGCVRLLLRAGAEVDAKANDFLTPLHYVAMLHGSTEVINVLIAANADVRIRTRWLLGNKLAREIAHERGYEAMERRLEDIETGGPRGELR